MPLSAEGAVRQKSQYLGDDAAIIDHERMRDRQHDVIAHPLNVCRGHSYLSVVGSRQHMSRKNGKERAIAGDYAEVEIGMPKQISVDQMI
jgi:hypothetical protein